MTITTVGIDLAKNVFQVHGVDERGKATLKKQLKRAQMADFFATLPPSFVGMEACGSAHHWARKLQRFGHTVRLMAPQFVKPYVKTNKNDAADAEAICEAVARPADPCTTNAGPDTMTTRLFKRSSQPSTLPLPGPMGGSLVFESSEALRRSSRRRATHGDGFDSLTFGNAIGGVPAPASEPARAKHPESP